MSDNETRRPGLEQVVDPLSRSVGFDSGTSASAFESSIRSGLGSVADRVLRMVKDRKTAVRGGAAALVLYSQFLASCGGDTGVNPPPSPPPPPSSDICVEDTAVNYANEIGLELDVTVYDSNEDMGVEGPDGCFTTHERDWIDALKVVEDEGIVSDETGATLQDFVDHFVTVGPLTVAAFNETYKHFKIDRQYEPEAIDEAIGFKPETLGTIALDVMLPDAQMPGAFHARGDFGPLTNYPIDEDTSRFSPPNLSDDAFDTETFLSLYAGYPECSGAEQVTNVSSINMSLDRWMDFESGTYPILWFEVFNGSLLESTVIRLSVTDTDHFEPHTYFDIALRTEIPEDDRILIDAEYYRDSYAHLFSRPAKEAGEKFYDLEDLPFREGDTIAPGESIGFVDPYLGAAFLHDITRAVPAEDLEQGPTSPGGRERVIDILGAQYYLTGGERTPGTNYGPTQLRLLDNRILGPCRSDGELVPLPDKP